MLDTLRKFGFYTQNNPKFMRIFRYKILQLILHGILALVAGSLIVNKTTTCSAPISIFLLGVFGTYIAGLFLNFTVCFGRCCSDFGPNYCSGSFKVCMKSVDFMYLGLYLVFCIIEFIWYVLAGYWYSMSSDCSSQFSNGYNATIGMLGLYFVLLLIYLVAFIGFMCYLKCNEVEQPKPPDVPDPNKDPNQGVPAENTSGLPQGDPYGQNYQGHYDPGYAGRPYPDDYNRGNQGYPDEYGRRPDDYNRGNQGYPDEYGRRPDDYYRGNQGYPDEHGRRPEDYSQYPENYQRRPEDQGYGQDPRPGFNHPLAPDGYRPDDRGYQGRPENNSYQGDARYDDRGYGRYK
ncbi:hypothetical protein SteCoe_17636 [Stentor coeruleus]|uniref:MARVEL domain-containing protein n=1 Tax=Stentor coeruleus TaxID=5963 RepID=A0A1R2BYW3_9CILI|nr:hypothetical protein SteCoe_17636 [Stentor coeruleus]